MISLPLGPVRSISDFAFLWYRAQGRAVDMGARFADTAKAVSGYLKILRIAPGCAGLGDEDICHPLRILASISTTSLLCCFGFGMHIHFSGEVETGFGKYDI